MKRLLAATAIVALVAIPTPEPAAASPTVYAHRGGAAIAPENTLGAFRHTHGVYGGQGIWLEMDAQRTSDGELVVIHDAMLDRTTDCTGYVLAYALADVQGCNAAAVLPSWPSFEPVPSLRQVLIEGRDAGWGLMVELKNIPGERGFDPSGAAAAGELLALVGETGFPTSRLLVQSFFPTSLDRIEAGDASIGTVLLTTSRLPGAPAGVGFTLGENAAYATARGYEVSSPDQDTLDLRAETVAAAHALGRRVVPWTVDDAEIAAMLAGFGVDGIITNDPGVVYGALD